MLNGTSGMLDNASVLESELSLVNEEGLPLANAMVDLTLTDQCGNVTVFEQDFQRAVVVPVGLCVDSTYALSVVNGDIDILDLTTDGMSLLGNDLLQDTLTIHATQVNGLWTLDSLTTGSVDWSGTVTLVDSCGRSTSAEWYVLEYACTEGCTDNDACNFTGEAGIEDGSCTYPGDSCDDGDETTLDETLDDNCDCVPVTDRLSEQDLAFELFPNPNDGEFRIVANVDQGLLRVRSADGRLVHAAELQALQHGVEVNLNLSNGMYVVEFLSEGLHQTLRVVVQR